jgi:hypothetical protein
MNRLLKYAMTCGAAALFAGTSLAQADTLTYSNTQILPAAYHNPQGFNIPKFDPASGTLNSVLVTIGAGSESSSIVFVNPVTFNGGVKYHEDGAVLAFYNVSTTLLSDSFSWQTPHYNGIGINAYERPGAGQTYTASWGPHTVPSASTTFTSPADLANFTGAGNAPLSAEFDRSNQAGFYGNGYTFNQNGSTTLPATVVYDFTPIPLPAAVWAGLSMFGAMGGVRILRRRRNANPMI